MVLHFSEHWTLASKSWNKKKVNKFLSNKPQYKAYSNMILLKEFQYHSYCQSILLNISTQPNLGREPNRKLHFNTFLTYLICCKMKISTIIVFNFYPQIPEALLSSKLNKSWSQNLKIPYPCSNPEDCLLCQLSLS